MNPEFQRVFFFVRPRAVFVIAVVVAVSLNSARHKIVAAVISCVGNQIAGAYILVNFEVFTYVDLEVNEKIIEVALIHFVAAGRAVAGSCD